MKKNLFIFKIIFIVFLVIANIVAIISTPYIIQMLPASKNYYDMIRTTNINNELENKMTLIYFSTEETNDAIKEERLNELINNTTCSNFVQFVKYEIIKTDTKNYLIYETISRSKGTNSVVLLDRLGQEIISFSADSSIEVIEQELKNIFKNYL